MRLLLAALGVAIMPAPAQAGEAEQPLPSRDVLIASDPLDQVGLFFPAELARTIESGRIWTGHLAPPGTFDAIFTGPVRDGKDGTCRRATYRFLLEDLPGGGSRIAERKPAQDLVAPRAAAGGARCVAATGMVPRQTRYPDRQLYGLRTLAEIIDTAKFGGIGPDQLECRTDAGECDDALATLAAFDPRDLTMLNVQGLGKDCGPIEGRTRLCSIRPVGEGEPFLIEARFPDRDSAQTWKLEWEARDGAPLKLSMLRTTII